MLSDDPPMMAFDAYSPTSQDHAEATGDYQCPEIAANIRIRGEDGMLIADMPLGDAMTLRPMKRHVYAGNNLVFSFHRVREGKAQAFRLDQWRALGMQCEREA